MGAGAVFLLVLSVFMLLLACFAVVFAINELVGGAAMGKSAVKAVIGAPFGVWVGVYLLSFVLHPCIILHEDRIEIRHLEGRRLSRSASISKQLAPQKLLANEIAYRDLVIYGALVGADLKRYKNADGSFFKDQWTGGEGGLVIKMPKPMPKTLNAMRDVFLFVQADGTSVVIDRELYGAKQAECLLYEIEARTGLPPVGRVTPKRRINSMVLDILKGCGVIAWCALPLGILMLQLISAVPAPMTGWHFFCFMFLFLANLGALAYVEAKRQKGDTDAKRLGKMAGIVTCVLYALGGIFLTLSFANDRMFALRTKCQPFDRITVQEHAAIPNKK